MSFDDPLEPRRLDDDRFRATFTAPMRNVTAEATNVIDIWPYVTAVPNSDLDGHEIYDRFVEYVYRDAFGRFDHVLVMTRTPNVYLAIVVDLRREEIYGHRLLDLNAEYAILREGR
jgi:hypothetical protein